MKISNFFLSVPNADGVFMGNKASEKFEEYSSLYEFRLFKDDPSKANFWLAEEAEVWALEDIDKRIKPVCKSENYSVKKKRGIKTIKEGVAELLEMSGNWKITEETEIEFLEVTEDDRKQKLKRDEEQTKQMEIEAKAKEAEARAKEAEARAKEAEARVREIEANAKMAEVKAKEATETKAKEIAEARAKEAEAKAKEAEARATEAIRIAEDTRKKAEAESRARNEAIKKAKQSSNSGCGKQIGCSIMILILLVIIYYVFIEQSNESSGRVAKTKIEQSAPMQHKLESASVPESAQLEPIYITNSDMYYIPVRNNKGLHGYITLEGKEITKAKYLRAYVFREGRALVQEQDSSWGYINTEGDLIASGYKQGYSFRDGIAWVNDNGTIKAIDANGNVAASLPQDIVSVWPFYDDLALFSQNGMQNYLDKNLQAISDEYYADGNRFQEDVASVMCSNGKYRYINKSASSITDCLFDDAKIFKNSKAVVRVGNDWGIIDKQGRYILSPRSDIETIIQDENMFKYKKKKGNWGWLNFDGQIAIQPNFTEVMSFGDRDITPVKKDSLWGYIDRDGKYIIDLQYAVAYPFINNRAFVKFADGYLATIDRNGKKDLRTEYQRFDNSYWEVINSGVATESRIMTVKPSSFSCDKPSNSERTAAKIICKSFNLISLDNRMNELYLKKKDYPYIGEDLVESNKEFLIKRNSCEDVYCLERVYEERIEAIEGI